MTTCKRGLCWPNYNTDPVFPFTRPGSKVSWLYNWSPNPTAEANAIEFIPMQWNHAHLEDLPNKIAAVNAKTVIAFNEPERSDQANMPVDLAVREWMQHIEPLRRQGGVRCGSPGISSAPEGVAWLKDFMVKLRAAGGDFDFYCLHWYGEALGQLYDYLWSTHHYLGPDKPVWLTEYACTNWNEHNPLPQQHVENFALESVKYLDTLDWIERYAWFGPMRNTGTVGKWARMLDDGGALTALGKAYRDS